MKTILIILFKFIFCLKYIFATQILVQTSGNIPTTPQNPRVQLRYVTQTIEWDFETKFASNFDIVCSQFDSNKNFTFNQKWINSNANISETDVVAFKLDTKDFLPYQDYNIQISACNLYHQCSRVSR